MAQTMREAATGRRKKKSDGNKKYNQSQENADYKPPQKNLGYKANMSGSKLERRKARTDGEMETYEAANATGNLQKDKK